MERKYLSFGDRVQLYNFIKTLGEVKGDYWTYKEGWSDKKVAEKFNYSVGNVTSVRSELGRLQTYTGAPYAAKLGAVEHRMLELEGHYRELGAAIEAINNKIKEIENKMSKLSLREHFRT